MNRIRSNVVVFFRFFLIIISRACFMAKDLTTQILLAFIHTHKHTKRKPEKRIRTLLQTATEMKVIKIKIGPIIYFLLMCEKL